MGYIDTEKLLKYQRRQSPFRRAYFWIFLAVMLNVATMGLMVGLMVYDMFPSKIVEILMMPMVYLTWIGLALLLVLGISFNVLSVFTLKALGAKPVFILVASMIDLIFCPLVILTFGMVSALRTYTEVRFAEAFDSIGVVHNENFNKRAKLEQFTRLWNLHQTEQGKCAKCGYEVAELETCPECGYSEEPHHSILSQ